MWRTTKAWGVNRVCLKTRRFELASETRTFESYLHGLEEVEARMDGLGRDVSLVVYPDEGQRAHRRVLQDLPCG